MLDTGRGLDEGAGSELAGPGQDAALIVFYDTTAIDAVMWPAVEAPEVTWLIYYNERCRPPEFRLADNIKPVPTDWVPVAYFVAEPTGSKEQADVVPATGATFRRDGSLVVTYSDERGAPAAVIVPPDERWADEIETLRAHAGVIAAQFLGER